MEEYDYMRPLTMEVLRKSQNITQTDLGDRVGLTQSEVSLLESGHGKPKPEILEKIYSILKGGGPIFYAIKIEDLLRPWIVVAGEVKSNNVLR